MNKPEINKAWDFIQGYLRYAKVREEVMVWVRMAYETGYDKHSDGITGLPELHFTKFKLKHPIGVMHDYLYEKKPLSRKHADRLFRQGLMDLGHIIRGPLYYLGLRFIFGWYYWRKTNPEHP